jgi:hypothetical protein
MGHGTVMAAYLDIETSFDGEITVIGIYLGTGKLVQLVGEEAGIERLGIALDGVKTLYTYNGSRFDLPLIAHQLGADLAREYQCRDLMYDCWDNGLYGGLKKIEVQLGIPRTTHGINGRDAMQLWQDYQNGNSIALGTLLLYNSEDVVNLSILRILLDLAGGQI